MTATAPQSIDDLAASHPCYTESAGLDHGRMHVPVAPRCNLGCAYCQRAVGPRAPALGGPGTTERIISPAEAAQRVATTAEHGWLHIVGIAGPGEPLANPETFETLRLVSAAQPGVALCLSTNGLLLPDALSELVRLGLCSLTITINTTDLSVAARLYRWADIDGERIRGPKAAREVLSRQWDGLSAAVRAGLLVKVNSVLIPGITDTGLAKVARRAGKMGAHRQNIMPLIPRAHLRQRRPPTSEELAAAQQECERWIAQFRGCTQCPADVVRPPLLGPQGVHACTTRACTTVARVTTMPKMA